MDRSSFSSTKSKTQSHHSDAGKQGGSVRQSGGTGGGSVRQSGGSSSGQSSKTTDNEIFALGDAASQLDDVNIDDLFATFGKFNLSRFTEDNTADGGGEDLQTQNFHQVKDDGTHVDTTVISGPQFNSQTVHITAKLPIGNQLTPSDNKIQLIDAPAVTSTIGLIDAPVNNNSCNLPGYINQDSVGYDQIVVDVPKSGRDPPKQYLDTTPFLKRNSGSYDNFHSNQQRNFFNNLMPHDMQETSLSELNEENQLLLPTSNDSQEGKGPGGASPWEAIDDAPPFPVLLEEQSATGQLPSQQPPPVTMVAPFMAKTNEKPLAGRASLPEVIVEDSGDTPWEHRNNVGHTHDPLHPPSDEDAPISNNLQPLKGSFKRKLSQQIMKIPLLLGARRRSSAADSEKSIDKENEDWERKKSIAMDDIQWYDPNEDDEAGEIADDMVSVDMSCMSCQCSSMTLGPPKSKKKRKRYSPKGAAKSGMMMAMKPGGELPDLQALVANYAKMLYQERTQFVDTMFRAVKLNKVDVLKILCKIVQKSDFALSSYDFREPESSATILHVALLYNHAEIIDFLLSLNDPDLILAKYETDEYRNQTGLHVAVANGDEKVIEKLLLALQGQERQVLINTIADGHYFKTRHPHGQLCLTAAAWAGHFDVVKILVKYGGNMRLKNSMGNTLLHSIIIQSATYPDRNDHSKLFTTIWDAAYVKAETLHYDSKNQDHIKFQQTQMQVNIFKQLLVIRNNDGYTPLALATTTLSPLLAPMLNMEKIYKIPQNKLGSIAWVTYDVTEITSFAQQHYNKFSVMHILAHNGELLSRGADPDKNNEHTDVFELEPIRTILENKWGVYRWMYIMWCLIHIFYMVLFTACTIEANSSPLFTKGLGPARSFHVQWWLCIFTLLPAAYIILEILDLFGNRPFRIQYMSNQNMALRLVKCVKSEWTIIGNGPYRMVAMGFACFNLQWFLLYASQDPNQDIALAMSLLLGWIFVLFFTRGCRVTCRFSIMIQNLFLSDLIYFLTVYSIVLIGFSFAMNAMFTYIGDADQAISRVFYDMMNVVTDLDRKQSTDESRHPLFTKLLLIVYAIVAVILLLNMLIAMMNTSYEIVTVTKCNLWKQQQLSIMLMIERRFFWLKCLPRKSEHEMWADGEGPVDEDTRYFLDVTMLHSAKKKS